jgi:hypothetical protein
LEAPSDFTSTLEREFQGRLRIRWSPLRSEWHIEEKVGRGIFEVPLIEWDDRYIRVRDGYAHVMAIQPRDTMSCPLCHFPIPVPVFETAEAKCDYCISRGRDARFRAAFYPLNHRLITFLKKIDPLRAVDFEGKDRSSIDELAREADEANARREQVAARNTTNEIESATLDNWKDLADIGRSTKPR